ncbi:Type 2A phosphatase-associated protein 42 [Coemansia brasiliensis]|uniref:Type 2A phosphatase-associated protein 42 n=1 Tax=Coemansia brasiliensis TaxID=2650707 RepID=A0A9W8M2U6_9FUNG|nr:Type 2A phosphatase-associated protein 42 [Coemansia brasiliensis]
MQNDISLGARFTRAQQQLKTLNTSTLSSNSTEYQAQVSAIIKQLEICSEQVEKLSLFSSNETTEDYSTSELKLLLIYAYLGEAIQKLQSSDRVHALEQASLYYKRFLTLCQDLHIDEPKRAKESRDAGTTRMQKIERFKQMRMMEQEIRQLEEHSAESNDMDQMEREHAVKLIKLKIYQVEDDKSLLASELEMARQMEAIKEQQDSRDPTSKPDSSWRLDEQSLKIDPRTRQPVTLPVFNEKGQPMRPFVLTGRGSERQEIKDRVFRPGWALPTMSVDEYLQQEKERGNIISGGGKEPETKQVDEDDYEALDAQVMKQREWDDFKDENPRGWGNRGGNRG